MRDRDSHSHFVTMPAGATSAPADARSPSGAKAVVDGIVLLILALLAYFLPALVASQRRHRNRGAIMVLNLFLGWTLIGWVLALVWAATANVETHA